MAAGSKWFPIHGQSSRVFLRGFVVYRATVGAGHLRPSGPGLRCSRCALLHESCCFLRCFAEEVTAARSPGLSSHCSQLPPKQADTELNIFFIFTTSIFSLFIACLLAGTGKHLRGFSFGREGGGKIRNPFAAHLLQRPPPSYGSLLVYSQTGRIHSPKEVTNKSKE